jgi:hypothetical protein
LLSLPDLPSQPARRAFRPITASWPSSHLPLSFCHRHAGSTGQPPPLFSFPLPPSTRDGIVGQRGATQAAPPMAAAPTLPAPADACHAARNRSPPSACTSNPSRPPFYIPSQPQLPVPPPPGSPFQFQSQPPEKRRGRGKEKEGRKRSGRPGRSRSRPLCCRHRRFRPGAARLQYQEAAPSRGRRRRPGAGAAAGAVKAGTAAQGHRRRVPEGPEPSAAMDSLNVDHHLFGRMPERCSALLPLPRAEPLPFCSTVLTAVHRSSQDP